MFISDDRASMRRNINVPTSYFPTAVFRKEVMASHMANHKDKVTVSCRLCGKTFAFASHLRMHSHGDKGSFRSVCVRVDLKSSYT